MKRIELDDDRLLLYTEYEERQLAASLPGRRWSPVKKCWSVPATPAVWRQVWRIFCEHQAPKDALEQPGIYRLHHFAMQRRNMLVDGSSDCFSYGYITVPWRHQVRMTNYVHDMDAALLDAWMGTGKTKAVLDAIINRDHHRTLVVCPTSVIDVWQDEVSKHTPQLRTVDLYNAGTVRERAKLLRHVMNERHDGKRLLILVNYEAYWRNQLGKLIQAIEWDCVVLDESHRIKAPGSKCSRFAAKLHAKHRICLTGTPMPHSPLDLYGQYRFLDPGIFGTRFAAFRGRYAVMGGYENKQVIGWRNQDELRREMDRLCYHVSKDVLTLPELQVLDRHCKLGKEAARVYHELEQQFVADVESGIVTAANALAKLLRLQQVTSGWVPVEHDIDITRHCDETEQYMKVEGPELEQVSTAKENLLRDMLEDLSGEKVVVFCRFHTDLDTVKRVAEELDRSCGEISGRLKEYRQWKNGEFSTLAVQIQAGGLGIDLTEARIGIFYSLGYSLGDYQQAYSRIHRPGQERPTVIYRLLARGTVDTKIVRALDKRKDVIDAVLSEAMGRVIA